MRECAERWRLELEEPFEYAFASLAVPAGDVVLKIQFPDREAEHEAEALRVWEGDGAVRLLEHDPERHALLLERARGWAFVQTLAWTIDETVVWPEMIEIAGWLLDAR